LVVGLAAREMVGGMRGCLRDSYVLIRRVRAWSTAAAFRRDFLIIIDLKTEAAD
jgi:hypothetical protein